MSWDNVEVLIPWSINVHRYHGVRVRVGVGGDQGSVENKAIGIMLGSRPYGRGMCEGWEYAFIGVYTFHVILFVFVHWNKGMSRES